MLQLRQIQEYTEIRTKNSGLLGGKRNNFAGAMFLKIQTLLVGSMVTLVRWGEEQLADELRDNKH